MAPQTSNTTTASCPSTIRLGTASPSTQPTKAATLAQLSSIAQRAAVEHIGLLLLPEAYVGGYPRGADFGCAVGSRTRAGRDDFAHYFESAADLGDVVGDSGNGGGERWLRRQLSTGYGDGHHDQHQQDDGSRPRQRGDGTREELERIARDTGVFLVVGVVERAGGTLYCAVVYVCPREGTLGKRRKVMPTGAERLCWGQGGAGTLRAVSTVVRGVRVNLAAAVCWENYMPLLRQALYAQNVNVYLAPTADGRDAWMPLMRTVAVEGRCFVVSSNMCQRRAEGGRGGAGGGVGDAGSRRKSMITADGHEIALPPPRYTAATTATSETPVPAVSSTTTTAATSHCHRSSRKPSVVYDDGNEIVLSCPDSSSTSSDASLVNNSVGSPSPKTITTTTHTAAAADEDDDDDESTACSASTEWLSRGGSSIVSPFGRVLAGPQWEDDTGLIYADVDIRDCIRGRLDLDAAGSYSRNDSFKLTVAGLDLDPLPYF